MKQTFLKTTLLLLLTIIFTNCDKEDIITEQKKTIETVSINEALNLFNTGKSSKTSKSNNEPYAIPNLDFISQEGIDNSNESLTIIPAYTIYGNVYSRIILLKIEGSIESVIFSMVRDKDSDTNQFSGKLYITDLDGNYINAFRVVDDILVSRFLKPTSTESKSSKNLFSKGDEEDCWGIACGMEGEEVVITVGKPKTINYIPLEILFKGGGGGSNTWGSLSGGGGSGSTACSEGYVKDSNGNCVAGLNINISDTPKIEDIKKELKCFNKSASAKLTIYSEQAIEKSREVTARLGHTFVGIEQNGIVRNLGFYPNNGGAANLISNQDSEIHNNSGSPYHISITVNISASQLSSILTYIENYPKKYDLNNYNCTDFGIGIAALGGLALPNTIGSYSFLGKDVFKGRNPSDLGEDMRGLSLPQGATRDSDGGKAPKRSSDCP